LLSEVFIAALAGRTRVVAHDSGSALPWLYGIAMNVLRRHFRQAAAQWAAAEDQGVDWDAVDARLDAEAKRGQLRSALNVLSQRDRELLLLVAWEGLTPAEAAEVLGIGKVAARSRLHRARRRALQALDRSGPDRPAVELLTATHRGMPA
jgi:RNA polymerase sigma-70 factor (ECF subfamily)